MSLLQAWCLYHHLLIRFVSSDILQNAYSPSLSVRLFRLKILWGEDRNYQSAVQKVLSSSQNVLRSCFYILLFCCGHKSPDSSHQHLLLSPHLIALLLLQALGYRGSGLFISPEWELLIPPVPFVPLLSFEFWAITITHPGPLLMIVLYQPPGPPSMDVSLAAFLVDCPNMVQSSFSYVTSTFPSLRGLVLSLHFYLTLIFSCRAVLLMWAVDLT